MRTFTAEQLKSILESHARWLRGEKGGSRANLSEANLSGADLSWANLSGANLSWANLSEANLSGANLSWANLSWANLSGANLSWANLSEANLSGANLSWANLSGAKQKIRQMVFGPLRARDDKTYWLYAVEVDGILDISIGCFRGNLAAYKTSVAKNGASEGRRAIKAMEAFFGKPKASKE